MPLGALATLDRRGAASARERLRARRLRVADGGRSGAPRTLKMPCAWASASRKSFWRRARSSSLPRCASRGARWPRHDPGEHAGAAVVVTRAESQDGAAVRAAAQSRSQCSAVACGERRACSRRFARARACAHRGISTGSCLRAATRLRPCCASCRACQRACAWPQSDGLPRRSCGTGALRSILCPTKRAPPRSSAPLRRRAVAGARILYPASSRALPTIAQGLTQLGAQVVQVEAYRTEAAALNADECRAWIERGAIGAVTFASPSAVIELERALGSAHFSRLLAQAAAVAIGPTTARALSRARQERRARRDRDTVRVLPIRLTACCKRGITDGIPAA